MSVRERSERSVSQSPRIHLFVSAGVGTLLFAGAAAVVLPTVSSAQVERTRGRLVDVADAARTLRDEEATCPSADDLVRAQIYSKTPRDPWGRRVEIRCEGERVTAVSAGPDGRRGTEDDIRR